MVGVLWSSFRLDKKQLKEEGFILAYSLGDTVHHDRQSMVIGVALSVVTGPCVCLLTYGRPENK